MRESTQFPGQFLVEQKELAQVIPDILVQIQNKWGCSQMELRIIPLPGTGLCGLYFDTPMDAEAVSEMIEWTRRYIRVNF